jgi:hypothetical protein
MKLLTTRLNAIIKKVVFLLPHYVRLISGKIETCRGFIRYTGYNRMEPTAGFRILINIETDEKGKNCIGSCRYCTGNRFFLLQQETMSCLRQG